MVNAWRRTGAVVIKQLTQVVVVVGGRGLVGAGLAHEHHALARRQDLSRLLAGHERRHHPLPATRDDYCIMLFILSILTNKASFEKLNYILQ